MKRRKFTSAFKTKVVVDFFEMGDLSISHEIGHVKFRLGYPDDDHLRDKLKFHEAGDKYNFMNAGPNPITTTDLPTMILRRYQWKKVAQQ